MSTSEALAEAVVFEAFAEGWTPDPDETPSEWAEANRVLDSTASSEPGPWRNARTPYLVEIQDSLSPRDPCSRITFMKGSQVGATEAGNNWIGSIVCNTPGPFMMVQPTAGDAGKVSRTRIKPMIASSSALSEKIRDPREKDSGNTQLLKSFPGGVLILTGAQKAKGLKGAPIRFLFCDEVDEYPADVEGQGDPIALAEKRTSNFPRRKIFLASTPTIKGLSRIEREFLLSDQRRYFVPCPHCGAMDWIRWENIRWEGSDGDGEHKPETAHLVCVSCSGKIPESFKTQMLARGEWRPTAIGSKGHKGYHLSSLYSPIGWKSWAEIAREFLEVKADRFRFKAWWNQVLGLSWEERGDAADADEIMDRLERYEAEVPAGVGILTCSVDVQGDRLEAKVKGFGAGEESWLIALAQFPGDPATSEQAWLDLDDFLRQTFTHESGQEVPITITCVDSGYLADHVYRFTKARQHRGVWAVRGGNEKSKPIVGRASANNRYRARVFTLCVDTAKDMIYSRLKIKTPGTAGFMHFPEWMDQESADQLTAETAVWKYVKGKGAVREWIKTRERNEDLDLEVYCLAGLYILGPSYIRRLPELAQQLMVAPSLIEEPEMDEEAARRMRAGWINGWRNT